MDRAVGRDTEGRWSASPLVASAIATLDPGDLIATLESDVRTKLRALVLVIAMIGMGRVRVICGRRTPQEQQRLWGMGRTVKECRKAGVDPSYAQPHMDKVTWIHPTLGKHVAGMAIDLDLSAYSAENFGLLQHAAKSVGVKWGGDWTVRDCGHFEV